MARFGRAFSRSRRSFSSPLPRASYSSRSNRLSRSRFRPGTIRTSKPQSSFLSAFNKVTGNKLRGKSFFSLASIAPKLSGAQGSLKKEVKLNLPHLIQGKNECGPTSLAMVMKYYDINNVDHHKMFGSSTVGHGPLALKAKAQAKGLTVRQENYGSLEDLAALVDKGIPPVVLGIYGGGSNSSIGNYIENASKAHWMVVTGYKTDESGKISHVYFNNPNKSYTQCWTAENFLNKFWQNNIIPGGHRYYMALAAKGSFKETMLKTVLPADKVSDNFALTLKVIDGLETTFYAGEGIVEEVTDTAEEVWDTVTDTAEEAADAVADAAKEVWSWFS